MNEQEATKLVTDSFTTSYDENQIRKFIKNLLADCEKCDDKVITGQFIPEAYRRKGIVSYKRLAKYTDPQDLRIDVLAVKISNASTLENARTMQRNFIAHYLTLLRGEQYKDAALVAFYCDESPDWRFSLVRMDYRYDEEEKKIKEDLTPARRFSFLVGENEKTHTACKQFITPLQQNNITLADLEQAFNIETVGREFYGAYKNLYIKLVKALENHRSTDMITDAEFAKKDIKTEDFAKKLLGQIVFLYFLQKKGWLGVARGAQWGTGSKKYLEQLYTTISPDKNFFNDLLEPLFYEALASERLDNYYSKLECRIPFLNGGLFEPIGNYDWVNTDILLDNSIFKDIFAEFDQYNFTVHEDAPLEKEVAIDPEMLGKVFENLIPDNERKGSGTFYTPRVIVHYMCQESLLSYLDSKLNNNSDDTDAVDRKDLETFIYKSEVIEHYEAMAEQKRQEDPNYQGRYRTLLSNIRANAQAIDDALRDIKICDPAVGSGAFPVGMMTEIVRLRMMLSAYDLPNKTLRTPYYFKYHAIQKSLYGVDIERSAVDIAKLRLWLSLVVDEDSIDDIYPLPNLDYKIMVGDSLLNIPISMFSAPLLLELEDLKLNFFTETSSQKKLEIKQSIDVIIEAIIADITIRPNSFDMRVFFSEVFSRNGSICKNLGFDIVIANPPYIQLQNDKGRLANLYEPEGYETLVGQGDIYQLFYEQGINVLAEKGHICYITSNTWLRSKFGKRTRKYFAKYNPKLLIDLGSNVFETATVDTNILLLQKSSNQNKTQAVAAHNNINDLQTFVTDYAVTLSDLDEKMWVILSPDEMRLLQKITDIGTPLTKWDIDINRGILTGFNDAFIIDAETKDALIEADPNSADFLKLLLRGRDIKQWHTDGQDKWLICFPKGWTNENRGMQNAEDFFINRHPTIYQHLQSFAVSTGKGKGLFKREDQGDYWWELRKCDYYQNFAKDKIIWRQMVSKPQFFLDTKGYYGLDTTAMIIGENLKFILAMLNSKLSFYAFAKLYSGGGLGDKSIIYKKTYLQHLPIPSIVEKEQRPFVDLVDQIHELQAADQDLSQKLDEIDKLVYQLYDLTDDEINMVEQHFG